MRRRGVVGGLAIAAGAMLFSEGASASGFAAARFGSEHGNVTETNPTVLYYNPAGIAFSEGVHLWGSGDLALRHATWEHEDSSLDYHYDPANPSPYPPKPGNAGTNVGKATLFNVFGGPALGATVKLGDFGFGAGLFVPFGGRAKWGTNDAYGAGTNYPQARDGVQRWHGIEGDITFIYATIGAAYRLGPVSVGVSGNLIFDSIKQKQAKEFAGQGENDSDQEGRSELDVSGVHGSFGVGVMYEAIPDKLWLGASYQAQPALGKFKMSGTLTNTDTSGTASADPAHPETLESQVNLYQSLPDVIRVGGRFRPTPKIELRLFGDYTRWSVMKDQCVGLNDSDPSVKNSGGAIDSSNCSVDANGSPVIEPDGKLAATVVDVYRAWKDTIGVRAGASYWFKPEIEAFVGTGFETAAVPTGTLDPALPDADTISGAIGGRFEIFEKLWLGTSYTHIQYLNREVKQGESVIALRTVQPQTRRPDGSGKYTSWVGVFELSLEKQF